MSEEQKTLKKADASSELRRQPACRFTLDSGFPGVLGWSPVGLAEPLRAKCGPAGGRTNSTPGGPRRQGLSETLGAVPDV